MRDFFDKLLAPISDYNPLITVETVEKLKEWKETKNRSRRMPYIGRSLIGALCFGGPELVVLKLTGDFRQSRDKSSVSISGYQQLISRYNLYCGSIPYQSPINLQNLGENG
jgi:hypothetical protein